MSEFFKKNGGKKDKAVASCSTETADEIDERGQAYDIPPPDPNFGDERAGGPNRNRLRYYCNRRSGLITVPVVRPGGSLYQRSRAVFTPSRPHKPRLDPFGCISDPEEEKNLDLEKFVHIEKLREPGKATRRIKKDRFFSDLIEEGEMAVAMAAAATGEMTAVETLAEREEMASAGAMNARGEMAAVGEMSAEGSTDAETEEMVAEGAIAAEADAKAAEGAMAAVGAPAFPKEDDAEDNGNLCSSFNKYFKIRE